MGNPSIWVLYDPSARGDRNAALGVAERLTENPFLVSIGAIEQAGGIGEFIRLRSRLAEVPSDPQIVISSSPPPVPYALSIKRYYSGKPFLVHLRDPIHNHKEFGLIAIPEHMPTPGRGSVCRFTGIANRVTAQRVSMEGEVWRKRLDPYNPYPKVAAMAGGSATKVAGGQDVVPFTVSDGVILGREIQRAASRLLASILITNSQRTPTDAWTALCSQIKNSPPSFKHDWRMNSTEENPFFAFLSHADFLIAPADSMSMLSECCSTGKPVYVAGIGCSTVRKDHLALVQQLIHLGHVRPASRIGEAWENRPEPLDASGIIAENIVQEISSAIRPRGSRHLKVKSVLRSVPSPTPTRFLSLKVADSNQ